MYQLFYVLLPLVFSGFVIFLMADGDIRFKQMKKAANAAASGGDEKAVQKANSMRVMHALVLTILTIFLLLLFASSAASFNENFPDAVATIKQAILCHKKKI